MNKDNITIYKNGACIRVYINNAEFMDEIFYCYNKNELLTLIKERLREYYQVKRLHHNITIKQWK